MEAQIHPWGKTRVTEAYYYAVTSTPLGPEPGPGD